MKREYLIKKWLDNELTPDELQAFKTLEDYDSLSKISNYMKHFKSVDFDTDLELEHVLEHIKSEPKQKTNWLKPLWRIAAILVICLGTYYYTTTLDTTLNTLASEKSNIELPDQSHVTLNALTKLTYNKNDWEEHRNISLEGEAYFKVAKGSRFTVETNSGTVTVLGTEFNVKQRENYFEVVCYEGSVSVTHNNVLTILKPGHRFLIINNEYKPQGIETTLNPSWINNESDFKSIPFKEVINEFERQYNVIISTKNINTNQLFSGKFTHNNIEIALKSITLPLNLTFSKIDHTIILMRE